MFNIEIAAQMSAWFIDKEGGKMSHLKLMKLLYLVERTYIEKHNQPLLGDDLCSMKEGALLSRTYDFMKGEILPHYSADWDKWVSPRENHEVSLVRKFESEDLDLLSRATIRILEDLWEEHYDKDQWDMVDYIHENCGEWKEPANRWSSERISYKRLLSKGFGYDKKKAEQEAENLEDQKELIHTLYKLTLE